MKNKYFFISIIACTAFLFFGCKKDPPPVPNYRFEVWIDLQLPDFQKEVFTLSRYYVGTVGTDRRGAGVGGLIIYRNGFNDYKAYDRYCPHDRSHSCIISMEDSNTEGVCECCESVFLINIGAQYPYGAPAIEGPSGYPLKQYRTRIEGNYLIVYN